MNKHLMKILILYGFANKSVSMNDRNSCPESKSITASFAATASSRSFSHSSSRNELVNDEKFEYSPESEYKNISRVNSFSSLNDLDDNFDEIKNWKDIVLNLNLKLMNSKGLDHDYAEVLNNLTDEKIFLLKKIQNKKNIFINYNESIFQMFDELNSNEKEFMENLREEDIYNYYIDNKNILLENYYIRNKDNKNYSKIRKTLEKLKYSFFNAPVNIENPKIKNLLDEMIINDFYIHKISNNMFKDMKSLLLNFKSWKEIEIKAIQQLIYKDLFFKNFEKITNAYYLNEKFNESILYNVKEVELDQVVEMAKKLNFEGSTDFENTRKIKIYENQLKESEDLLEYYKYMSFSYIEDLLLKKTLEKDTTNFIDKMKELKLIPDNFSEKKLIYSYVINEINSIKKKNKSVIEQEELIKKHFEKKIDEDKTNLEPSIFEQFITDESLYEFLYEFLYENQTIPYAKLISNMDTEKFKLNFRKFIENNISKLESNKVDYDEQYLESLLSFDILKKVILNKVSKGEDVTKKYLNSFLNSVKDKELSKCSTFNFIYEKFNSNITFKIENIIKKIEVQKNKINHLNESEKYQLIWGNFMTLILEFLMDEDSNNLSQEISEFNDLLLSYLRFELFKSISDLNKYYSKLKEDCNNINFNNLRVALKNLNHYDKCFLVAYEFIEMSLSKNKEDFPTNVEMFQDNRCKFKEMMGKLLPLISHKIEKEEFNKEKNFVKEYIFSNKKNELDLEFQFSKL